MTDTAFLKIGDIKGESVDAKHKDEIDVLAWDWGMNRPVSIQGGGSAIGKVSVQGIQITKYCDAATAPLIIVCCTGKHYPEARLALLKAGARPLEYLRIILKDVIITAQSTASENGNRPTEIFTLNFSEFKLEYTSQKADGTAGPVLTAGWNIPLNKVVQVAAWRLQNGVQMWFIHAAAADENSNILLTNTPNYAYVAQK